MKTWLKFRFEYEKIKEVVWKENSELAELGLLMSFGTT